MAPGACKQVLPHMGLALAWDGSMGFGGPAAFEVSAFGGALAAVSSLEGKAPCSAGWLWDEMVAPLL